MSLSVAELQAVLHDLFTTTADSLAKQTGFCQRARKLPGSVFAQSLVFGLLENPDSTLDDYADFAGRHLDLDVSANAFDQRFTPAAVRLMLGLFLEAFKRRLDSARPRLLPILRRFAGVYVRDATLVGLPGCLAELFPGRPGRGDEPAAALKLVLEMEVSSGQFTEVSVLPGTANDKTAAVADKPLPRGSLLLEDRGFFCGRRMQDHINQGVYVLTRVPSWTAFFEYKGRGRGYRRLNLLAWLRRLEGGSGQRRVVILHKEKLLLRLVAVRVPEKEAEERRQRVREEAKKHQRPVSQKKLEMCQWTILLTNAPESLLRVKEAFEVRRVRWQIELIFKLFKSEGGLERTRSEKPWRVLAELFAKLLAMVVQQWVLLAAGYVMLVHSGRRAARRVRRVAGELRRALTSQEALARPVERLAKALRRYGGIDRRRKTPSTLDRLAALDPELTQLNLAA
jgi:Transposase DDE domain